MGSWFFRRSWSFGPFRVNVTDRGVGVSVGIRGFRLGLNRGGPYLQVGFAGLYYRTSLRQLWARVGPDEA
jgi:hypothetical protein